MNTRPQSPPSLPSDRSRRPGPSRYSFATALGPLEIAVCTPRIVRVRLVADGRPAGASYVAVAPDAWPPVDVRVRTGESVEVDTGVFAVRIDTDPLQLTFCDPRGEMLRAPIADGVVRETVHPRSARSPATEEQTGGTGAHPYGRERIAARFIWEGEQHFYGLGEGGKQFDRLDGARQLWNSHFVHGPGSDIGVPLLLSTRGYGLFFDNTADAQLVVGRSDTAAQPPMTPWATPAHENPRPQSPPPLPFSEAPKIARSDLPSPDRSRRPGTAVLGQAPASTFSSQIIYRAEGGPLDWYFLYGGDLRGALAEVAALLGRPLLPPRWALGFLQSSRHFEDTEELRRLPRTLREKRIPCDGIILLSSYGDAHGWNRGVGHLEWQPDLVPDPAGLIAEVRDQGFQVITHEYPVLHEESPLFAEAERSGYLLAEGYRRITPAERPTTNFQEGQRYIDFSNPAARRWWWERHRPLADMGVGGWWLDGGEGPPASSPLHAGDGLTLHNLYDRLRQQAFAEGEAHDYPDRRPFLLCRSGAAGMQRYGATCWSGDINNTFATLEAQIPLGLNTGLSGIPYWGTDIGGFFHPLPESAELYVRWFQFGAFCPSFRAHGFVWREHLPWAHGPEVEAICRLYAELRYRLLPYTYTLAWQARTLGLPPMRPLVLNYPGDPRVWELGSEYLWGDDLLVAPVTREGATAWPVYLPEGAWYDFWTQECYRGPAGTTVEAPLDRLPLFVRGGAILPLAPPAQFDGARPWDEVTLLIYPEGASRFELYEDDGRTNAYRDGHYAITPISCRTEGAGTVVQIGEPVGDRALLPADRTYTLQIWAAPPRAVALEGVGALPLRRDDDRQGPCYWHDGGHFLHVRLRAAPSTVSIEGP